MLDKINSVKEHLQNFNNKISIKSLVGFDGYVDSIIRPVMNTTSDNTFEYFPTIEEFGKYIQGKAGKGCCIQLNKSIEKSGGNAYLFANGLAALELKTTCIGAFGFPDIHPVFHDCHQNLTLKTVAQPGFCSALEFLDGKVMLGDSAEINKMDFNLLNKYINEDNLLALVEDSEILSFMNWSELQGSNDLWRGFIDNIFPRMKSDNKKKMFIDVADCSVKDRGDVFRMLKMIREISEYCDVILSLNLNEFQTTSSVLEEFEDIFHESWDDKAEQLYTFCGLKYLCVHLRDSAYGYDGKGHYRTNNKLIQKPKVSTGGGDNFNAGLLYGLLTGLDIQRAMITANAASGFYITRGHGASKEELINYLEEWSHELC